MVDEKIKNAERLFSLGEVDRAEKEITVFLQGQGPKLEAYKVYLPYLIASDRLEDALGVIEKILLLSDKYEDIYEFTVKKASVLLDLGRVESAKLVLYSVSRHRPKAAWFSALRKSIGSRDEIETFTAVACEWMGAQSSVSVSALYHYSVLCRDFGLYDRAHFAARSRFIRMLKTTSLGGKAAFPQRNAWANEAAVALRDLKDDLGRHGIEFFLISGTLLGCVREGTVLGHDKDIDVGVDERYSIDEIRHALSASKRFQDKGVASENGVYVRHLNGVDIDVFRHFMSDGKYVHQGVKVSWWNSPITLKEAEFLGGTYLIPVDHDTYLRENYGEWKTPVKEFETMVDTPNMVVNEQDHLIWYFITRLADYYSLGKLPQFKRVYAALDSMWSIDSEMRNLCEDVLAGHSPLKKWRPALPRFVIRNVYSPIKKSLRRLT